jgi:predicted nucleotidyltransferase
MTALGDFCAQVEKHNDNLRASVILIGSVARGTETPRSDLDLLLLTDRDIKRPPNWQDFHVHLSTKNDFLKRLREGDDFAAWCVRYGVMIRDSGDWAQIREAPEASIWPDWQRKIGHAVRRLLFASALLQTGDGEASAEEMLYAVGHTVRAILLRSQVFPLSRAELVQQARDAGFPHLSAVFKRLLYDPPSGSFLRQAEAYCKRLLCYLDRAAYRREALALTKRGRVGRHP